MAKKKKNAKHQNKHAGAKGKKEQFRKKSKKRDIPQGLVFIKATFNNTIISVTDPEGNVVASSSPGGIGFKGSKKSTAFAATKAAEDVALKAQKFGVKEVDVYVRGPGAGRSAAIKGLDSAGLKIRALIDVTRIPFGGCRPKKQRRV